MATTTFKTQVEMFLRRAGLGNIVITFTAGSPNNTLSRISFEAIYDYFYTSGLALFRVMKRVVPSELKKLSPSFYFEEEVNLSSNSGTIATVFDSLSDEARAQITGPPLIYRRCTRFPEHLSVYYLTSSGERNSPSATNPVFNIVSPSTIKVYPTTTTFNKIVVSGLKTVARIPLTDGSGYSDIWNPNLSDLLIEGAVMLYKGDSNEIGLENLFYQRLVAKYNLFQKPITKLANSAIEEQR